MEPAEGVVVKGRYRLTRQLGRGGMGSVWLADDLSLDTQCAVKVIDDDKAILPEVRVRFAREAKAAAQLRGPHVVDVFDRGEHEGVLYLAMEYLEGEDLGSRLMRTGALDPETTYRIIAHVARALTNAHALGIVHRDLKPENVFLIPGYDGEIAKVLDFGIAQHEAYALKDRATRTGSFMGTPFYVSPEQARGKITDSRTDLWSLGVIAFECLTGAPPFESESLGDLMGLILYEPLPMPTQRNPRLPPAVDAWWERAAAREREERFQSAQELADALREALGLETLVVVSAGSPYRSGSMSSVREGDSLPPPDIAPISADPVVEVMPHGVLTQTAPAEVELGAGSGRVLARLARSWSKGMGALRPVVTLVRTMPRRRILAIALPLGILLGAAVSLAIVSSLREPSSETESQIGPVGIVSPASRPPNTESTPTIGAASATSSRAVVVPEDLPRVPVDRSARRRDYDARKKAPAPVKRKAGDVPDYGI